MTCPGTIAKRNPETGTHNARPRDPRRTTYPLRRVCGNCKIVIQQSPLRNTTYERNLPKPQPNEACPPAVHQTKPRHKTTGNTDGTTHPPKRVPSLCENPPNKHPDEPTVCAATQARNSRPPNMMINDIAYHTPAAVVCDLDPTPATPPNKHGRMTAHPPNESHEWQQVETTMQTPDEPHTRRSGCGNLYGILLNPHPPTKAMTPPTENTWPR
ncbi:hypothetical protein BS47DRAFT_1370132, partial [Hydnum rufescens UP504]